MRVSREELQGMWEAAKLNRDRIAGCKRHRFVVTELLARHIVCLECEGKMEVTHAYAYADGYTASGACRADVLTESFDNG